MESDEIYISAFAAITNADLTVLTRCTRPARIKEFT